MKLDRFKATFKMKNSVPIRPFNAVIGRNGAGKSTLVEALQWIDTALRYDVMRASDRFNGLQYLINHRSVGRAKGFVIALTWSCLGNEQITIEYRLHVELGVDGRSTVIDEENLDVIRGV